VKYDLAYPPKPTLMAAKDHRSPAFHFCASQRHHPPRRRKSRRGSQGL